MYEVRRFSNLLISQLKIEVALSLVVSHPNQKKSINIRVACNVYINIIQIKEKNVQRLRIKTNNENVNKKFIHC